MQKVKFALPLLASLVWAPAQATLAPLLDPTLNSMSIFAATYVTTGVAAHVYGSFLAGAGATVGASSVTRSSLVTGNLLAVEGVTLGVGVTVGGNLLAGAGKGRSRIGRCAANNLCAHAERHGGTRHNIARDR
jgi:hypothetical protein